MPVKSPDTFSVLLYPVYIPGTDNPTHQSKLQKDIWYKKIHLSLPESDFFHPENALADKFPQNPVQDIFSAFPASLPLSLTYSKIPAY